MSNSNQSVYNYLKELIYGKEEKNNHQNNRQNNHQNNHQNNRKNNLNNNSQNNRQNNRKNNHLEYNVNKQNLKKITNEDILTNKYSQEFQFTIEFY